VGKLLGRKTRIVAQTECVLRKRPLVIEITPYTVILREKGRRERYEVSWGYVYYRAAERAASAKRDAKKKEKR